MVTLTHERLKARGPWRAGIAAHRYQVGAWLFFMCALVAAMILIGGATRLTDSGLSITEWRPVTGTVPPLSAAAWEAEFEKYRQIPEYQLVNKGMSLEDFKTIYWWEWGHRFLGRLIGLAFLAGFLYFYFTRRIAPAMVPRLGLLFLLGGAQGALGWYMVMSGLSERVDVSQYRLAAHLGLAFIIYAALFWTALDLTRRHDLLAREARTGALRWAGGVLLLAVFIQIVLGAFVAGLDAGRAYTDWPLMGGEWLPGNLFAGGPWHVALFEDPLTVQFAHRMGAYAVFVLTAGVWFYARMANRRGGRLPRSLSRGLDAVAILVLGQAVLGIVTLVHAAPLGLSLIHQAGAIALFSATLYLCHLTWARAGEAAPAPSRETGDHPTAAAPRYARREDDADGA